MKQALLKTWIGYFSSLCRSTPILLILCVANTSAAAIIDVTNYGAIPNDSVDDSLAIQQAINAAPDNTTIYFPKGTYLLCSVQINNRKGLTLSGAGSTSTILRHHGSYPSIFLSSGSTDMLVTQLGFDTNGLASFGGFVLYDAKRITITKNHFFDSNKQPVAGYDRYSWVFGRGSVPSEDILISDNLIEDLQLEVDFSVRVRIEGNTIVRPVQTAGIGVFTINDNTTAQEYTIQKNTIVDPVVSAGGIVLHLDPPSSSYSTMKSFRILDNHIVYTKYISGSHASAIRLGTGDNSQATTGNVFDDIAIQNNVVYKDPGSQYDFGDINAIIFGNSSATANFKFNNTNVSNNRIYYNNTWGLPITDIRQQGVNYSESKNLAYTISADIMPPSVPTALTTTYIADNQIDLAWNASVDNIGVYRYRIYRNGAAIGYSTITSYVDKNLQPGVSYAYAVTAIDLSGVESSQSYPVTVKMSGTANPISATPPAPIVNAVTLTASPASTPAGGTLASAWTAIASPTSTDWIGLYQRGAANTSYLSWIYVSCSKTPGSPRVSGSCPFVLPASLPAGVYELRLFANNGSQTLATSNGLTVTVMGPTLTANPASIPSGGTLASAWTAIASPTSRDWIGLYQRGAANTSYVDWIYMSCAKTAGGPRSSGSCPFVVPASLPAGTYELRMFANNGYATLATSNALVVASAQASAK